MPIKYLWQLIYTFTYDKKSCGHMTKDVIDKQLMKWKEFIRINEERELNEYGLDPLMASVPVGKKGSVIDEMKYQLIGMCNFVVKEEAGLLEHEVENVKKHKLDFRMLPGICDVFPEYCAARRNYSKGAEALKVNMEDKPHQYSVPKKKPMYFIGGDV